VGDAASVGRQVTVIPYGMQAPVEVRMLLAQTAVLLLSAQNSHPLYVCLYMHF